MTALPMDHDEQNRLWTLPALLADRLTLVRQHRLVVTLEGFRVFGQGVEFTMFAKVRDMVDPVSGDWDQDWAEPVSSSVTDTDRYFTLVVRYADGRSSYNCLKNGIALYDEEQSEKADLLLQPEGGEGGVFPNGDGDFKNNWWLSPLPDGPGPVEFELTWGAGQANRATVFLEGEILTEASHRAVELDSV
ncbi:hypothetical protein D1871_16500 [Nakamurella silvestris]|nr:hypothetical protein D1871_16500 [Nakamurella silvestris]